MSYDTTKIWDLKEFNSQDFSKIPMYEYGLPIDVITAWVYCLANVNFWGYWQSDEHNPDNKFRMLQIGCAQGTDATSVAQIIKSPHINGELHVIDWFKGNLTVEEEEWAYNEKNVDSWKQHFYGLQELRGVDNIILHEGDSREVIKTLPDNYFDLIYIDGGHEYSIVKSDIENSLLKVKDNGVIIGDDFSGPDNAYEKYNLADMSPEEVEFDTQKFDDGNLFHAGVVKAIHETLDGNYIKIPHDKFIYFNNLKITKKK